jgi:hypothetical protein
VGHADPAMAGSGLATGGAGRARYVNIAVKAAFAAMRPDERTSDVIRRALRLLEREVWLTHARSDAERLAAEDLSGEADAFLGL